MLISHRREKAAFQKGSSFYEFAAPSRSCPLSRFVSKCFQTDTGFVEFEFFRYSFCIFVKHVIYVTQKVKWLIKSFNE